MSTDYLPENDMNELLKDPQIIKALQSVILAITLFLLARIGSRIANKNGKRPSEAPFIIRYMVVGLFIVSMVFIWFEGLAPILTALTIVAAALTIVSKELILNFLGSFIIFWRELFAIGDRVQVGEYSGDVISKGVFYFTLLETGPHGSTGHSTGRMVKVPNALALTMPVVNATRGAGYVWHELSVSVSRDSDWKKAKEHLIGSVGKYYERERIVLARIKEVFEQRNIFFNKLEPRVYVDVSNGGIRLTLRYLCRARLTRDSQDYIIVALLNDLESLGIKLAEEQT